MNKLTWTMGKAKLCDLAEYEKNPVELTEHDARQLAKSIKKYPEVLPYIAAAPKNGGSIPLLDGHQRKKVSIELLKMSPDSLVDVRFPSRKLTEKERQELIVRLRKNTGRFDNDGLLNWFEPSDLQDWGFNQKELEFIGFEFEDTTKDAEPQVDRAAELLKKWKVKSGDMFTIGDHRLICGDCTDAATVARVMGGERAEVCPTSPPYADQRDYELGDFDYMALYNGFMDNTKHCNDILVNLGLKHEGGKVVRYWEPWLEYCESKGLSLFGWYVWDQLSGFPGDYRGRLARSHEFVFHFRREAKQANKWIETTGESKKRGTTGKRFRQKDGSLKQLGSPETVGQDYKVPDSVIRIRREMARGIHTESHPAVFSLEFAAFFIKTWSQEGGVVYEPFCGSGTTLVACENLDRPGRGIELSPAYVAVALQRMHDAFPHLKIEKVK